jgi:hypothetical protein
MIRDGRVYCDECGGVIMAGKWGGTGIIMDGKVRCRECSQIVGSAASRPWQSGLRVWVWIMLGIFILGLLMEILAAFANTGD